MSSNQIPASEHSGGKLNSATGPPAGEDFKTALYQLMWTEERDIGDVDTLVEAGERIGLDGAELLIFP